MYQSHLLWAVAILSAMCILEGPDASRGGTQTTPDDADAIPQRNLDQLVSRDVLAQSRAFQRLEHDRRTVIHELLRLARSDRQGGPYRAAKDWAIRTLGTLRAPEACQLLVDQITYLTPWPIISEDYPLVCHRAAHTLVEIGHHSIDAIMTRLGAEVSNEELKLFAFVIEPIDGRELGLLRVKHIAEAAAREGNRSRMWQRNILRLIEIYRATDFDNPRHWPPRNYD